MFFFSKSEYFFVLFLGLDFSVEVSFLFFDFRLCAFISEGKTINEKSCYRIGVNNGKQWKEPLKKYHRIDMNDCFQYYNTTILEFIASRI